MIRFISTLRRFRRDTGGAMPIEFALWFPLFLIVLLATVEMGIVTAREAMLERGLDIAVRDVRLDTGTPPQHDALVATICEKAAIIPDCAANLRLEMVKVNMRDWKDLPAQADCTNRIEGVQPYRQFTSGLDNQMMVLRACSKFRPMFPSTRLGHAMTKDSSGDIALVVSTAFVQEPR